MSFDWKAAVPWMLTLAALLAGIWQYVDKTAQSNREPFLREQLRLAVETSEVAATLATTADADAWKKARARFWTLYWGPLSLVENRDVEARMKAFQAALLKAGPDVPIASPTGNQPTELQLASYQLAHALRAMVSESWGADLDRLSGE